MGFPLRTYCSWHSQRKNAHCVVISNKVFAINLQCAAMVQGKFWITVKTHWIELSCDICTSYEAVNIVWIKLDDNEGNFVVWRSKCERKQVERNGRKSKRLRDTNKLRQKAYWGKETWQCTEPKPCWIQQVKTNMDRKTLSVYESWNEGIEIKFHEGGDQKPPSDILGCVYMHFLGSLKDSINVGF